MELIFPSSFLWGASISSYQTEGNNFNSDWFIWEKEKKLEPAGKATNHYSLFKEDFLLANKLNLNCLRFSIEWARLSISQNNFLEEGLNHYEDVILTLKNFNLIPLVNLHHFTNPIWFAKKGGWLVSKNIDYFIFYIKKVIERLKNLVDYWLIFNEPLVYVYNSYILGIWPPGKKSFYEAKKVLKNIIKAYILSYQEIKRIYKNKTNSFPKISFTKHLIQFLPCREKNFILNLFSTYFRDKIFNFKILEDLFKKNYLDFLAINYYTKQNIRFGGLLGKECNSYLHNERKNFLGWYVYPDGLFNLLIKLKKFNLPIIITENGTAETQDILYKDYLLLHLKSVHKAILKKVNVKGYLWWSLIDNFEWDKGFGPRFGLIEVNYKTFERKIKPFALVYAKIAKENKIVLNGA